MKLKPDALRDEKPVKLTVELPAATHRNLFAYAEMLQQESGEVVNPVRLVAAMLEKFMATDREFARRRRARTHARAGAPNSEGA